MLADGVRFDAVFAVLRAVDVDVGLEELEEGDGVWLGERGGVVDKGEGADHLEAVGKGDEGAGGPLVPFDGVVGVEGEEEDVSLEGGLVDDMEVASVKKVEGAVKGSKGLAGGAQGLSPGGELVAGQKLVGIPIIAC